MKRLSLVALLVLFGTSACDAGLLEDPDANSDEELRKNKDAGACIPESNAALCTRLGHSCGTINAVDNCGANRSVTCGGPCAASPDLVITALSMSPASIAPGAQVLFSATVKNQGTGATPAGAVAGISFYVDGIPVSWSESHTASIPAGEAVVLTATTGAGGSASWTATAGGHVLLGWVDSGSKISESSEDNNQLTLPFNVAAAVDAGPVPPDAGGTGLPDLVITSVASSPASPGAGAAVTFQATVKNQGNAATAPGTIVGVAFFIDASNVAWSDSHTQSLAPGASVVLNANGGPAGSPTWTATAGAHTLMAWVDDLDRIPESDQDNNKLTQAFSVATGADAGSPADAGIKPDAGQGSDAGVPLSCGNGSCEAAESCVSCPADCNPCPAAGAGLMVYHPDLHSRLRAKILATVTTPNAARLRINLSNAAAHWQRVVADVPVPSGPESLVGVLDVASLAQGTYALNSLALNATGTVLASKVETFSRAISGAPAVGFDEHNALYKDGQPLFPVTMYWGNFADWSPRYLPGLKNAGRINVAEAFDGAQTAAGFAAGLDQCAANGIPAIGPIIEPQVDIPAFVAASKAKPALLAWSWMDEPEYKGVSAATVRGWTDQTHALDPHHPVEINLVGPMFVGQGGSQATARSFTSDPINAGLPAAADWLGTDYYPVGFKCPFNLSLQQAFDSYAEHLANLRAFTKDLYPLKTYVEACSMPDVNELNPNAPGCVAPVPTPAQMWAEVWIAITKGVKAISWIESDSSTSYQSDPGTPEIEAKAFAYIQHFALPLLQPDSSKVTRTHLTGSGRVDFIAKEQGGKLYVFAVNRDVAAGASARFDLAGFAASAVAVYDEGRSLSLSGGSFTDSFGPLAVHVYEIY